MAGFKGADACNETLDAWLGSTVLGPATVWIALFTAAPTSAGGGTEVTGGSYARLEVDNDGVTWDPAAAGVKLNAIAFDFGTASANWGTVSWAAVVTTASGTLTGAHVLYAGPLSTARLVLNGDSFQVPIGGGQFTEL